MKFSELKPIFDTKTFDILAALTDNPTCDIYVNNFDTIDNNDPFDPFDSTTIDATNVIIGEPIFVANVRCIYTYDKLLVQENDTALGSSYTLILYIRADDIPPTIKDTLTSVLIKFNGVFYNIKSHLNLYNILHEFNLG